jgi:hemerythrin-like domain-containing protein
VLFPELVRAGYSWDDGLLSRIRQEHNQERYLMRTLRHASLQKTLWSSEDLRHLVSLARTFIEFQRAHIAIEDKEILPVLRELPDNVQQQLSERLERFSAAWADGGEDAWLRGLAQDLVERYAPGHAAPDDTSPTSK